MPCIIYYFIFLVERVQEFSLYRDCSASNDLYRKIYNRVLGLSDMNADAEMQC